MQEQGVGHYSFQYMFVFFIILRNSASLTSPSPSLSASSIISWNQKLLLSSQWHCIAYIIVVFSSAFISFSLSHIHTHTHTCTCMLTNAHVTLAGLTCSSSSVRFSPNSLHTLFRLLKEILPLEIKRWKNQFHIIISVIQRAAHLTVSSSSNSLKAFSISSFESFSLCETHHKQEESTDHVHEGEGG